MIADRMFLMVAAAATLVACSKHTNVVEGPPTLTGEVVSTTGDVIANAKITLNDANTVTDNNGAFTLDTRSDANTYAVVRVSAAGYPDAVRRLLLPSSGESEIRFTLRPVDYSQTFTLPSGKEPPADFNITRTTANAALRIGPASLVDVNGNIAVGDANLSLTFWSPDDDVTFAPGVMRASDGNRAVTDRAIDLLSYGMLDIDLEQNGNRLQVAPGAALQLNFTTTDARRQAVASRGGDVTTRPGLWTLNPNTGLWDQDVGNANYDVATGVMQAELHHLSTVNSDEPYTVYGPPTGDSGCIIGRVYGGCGQPLPGALVTLNVANSAAGTGVPANWIFSVGASGQYKANVRPSGHNNYYASASWNGHRTDMTQSPVDPSLRFISWSPATPNYPRLIFAPMTCSDVSGQCQNQACSCFNNPADPGHCMEQMEAEDPQNVNGYNPCWQNPLGQNWLGQCFDDQLSGSPVDTRYASVWKSWKPTTLCANCWPIVDMVFKDVAGDQSADCTGQGANGQGCCPSTLPPGAYNICSDLGSPHRKTIGQTCSVATDTCCGGGLMCADNVCVPNTDPQ